MHARILAIDYGSKRLGLAVSDGLGLAAHPLPALRRSAGEMAALAALVGERDVARVVVGLPLHMDGREGSMAAEARAFGGAVASALGLPVIYEDERLSTDEAEARLASVGLRPPERRRLRDSVAAAIILEGVLAREREGTPETR